jgi:hypothetical protein
MHFAGHILAQRPHPVQRDSEITADIVKIFGKEKIWMFGLCD